jgi:hypothetical protein
VSAPAPDLAERYGAPSPSRRPVLLVVLAVVGMTGLSWVVWVWLFHSSPQVTSSLVGYDVQTEHTATATYTVVRRDAEVSASCLLRAYAPDHNVVGELSVAVDSGPTTASLRSTLRTERRASSIELVGCTAAGQSQQR